MSSATDRPESLWPPAEALRDTALLLAGLVLVVLLADGQLVLWVSAVLVIVWAVLSFRRGPEDAAEPPMWARLLPLFAAILLAQVIAPNEWSVVALVALAAPVFALTRAGLVLHERRSA